MWTRICWFLEQGERSSRQAGGGHHKVAESRSIDLVKLSIGQKPIKQFWRCKMRVGLFTDAYFPQVSE